MNYKKILNKVKTMAKKEAEALLVLKDYWCDENILIYTSVTGEPDYELNYSYEDFQNFIYRNDNVCRLIFIEKDEKITPFVVAKRTNENKFLSLTEASYLNSFATWKRLTNTGEKCKE